MKTIILAGALAISGLAPVSAQTVTYQTFAGCVGRYSAEMEHAWLVGASTAQELQERRQQFLGLLDATVPKARARDVMNYRIETKLAHASLLTLASFHQEDRRSRAARLVAQAHISRCRALLLGG